MIFDELSGNNGLFSLYFRKKHGRVQPVKSTKLECFMAVNGYASGSSWSLGQQALKLSCALKGTSINYQNVYNFILSVFSLFLAYFDLASWTIARYAP